MRKKIVAANWKMNMTQAESARYIESLLLDLGDIADVEVVILPPFTAIAKVTECLDKAQNIKVGAQNMHWERSGAFTGEISAPLLRDLFVRYVVLGHSERRTLFGETDEIVNLKVRAAHEATLRPIVCIGTCAGPSRWIYLKPPFETRDCLTSFRIDDDPPAIRYMAARPPWAPPIPTEHCRRCKTMPGGAFLDVHKGANLPGDAAEFRC